MTPTSEERREVAGYLRDMGPQIRYKEQFFDELAEVVLNSWDYHDFNDVLVIGIPY